MPSLYKGLDKMEETVVKASWRWEMEESLGVVNGRKRESRKYKKGFIFGFINLIKVSYDFDIIFIIIEMESIYKIHSLRNLNVKVFNNNIMLLFGVKMNVL